MGSITTEDKGIQTAFRLADILVSKIICFVALFGDVRAKGSYITISLDEFIMWSQACQRGVLL